MRIPDHPLTAPQYFRPTLSISVMFVPVTADDRTNYVKN